MTREKAIEKLKNFADHCYPNEEFLMAIKALEQEPCEDAISREDALMCMTGEYPADAKYSPEDIISKHIRRIKALPSVTPKQRTGHWIKDDITERSKGAYKHKCDRCGAYHRTMYDYCPSCGAKMIEPQESEDKE